MRTFEGELPPHERVPGPPTFERSGVSGPFRFEIRYRATAAFDTTPTVLNGIFFSLSDRVDQSIQCHSFKCSGTICWSSSESPGGGSPSMHLPELVAACPSLGCISLRRSVNGHGSTGMTLCKGTHHATLRCFWKAGIRDARESLPNQQPSHCSPLVIVQYEAFYTPMFQLNGQHSPPKLCYGLQYIMLTDLRLNGGITFSFALFHRCTFTQTDLQLDSQHPLLFGGWQKSLNY